MTKRIPLPIGKKFGQWEIVGEEFKQKQTDPHWRVPVKCSCGFIGFAFKESLKSGKSTKCRNCQYKSKQTHGMSYSPEYWVWRTMLSRCYNKNHVSYNNYGASGVTVCDRWNPQNGGSFENFYKDLGPRPSSEYHLDKEMLFPGNKIYGPGLAGWVHRKQNIRKRSNSRFVELNGRLFHIGLICEKFNISYIHFYRETVERNVPVACALRAFGYDPNVVFLALSDADAL